MLYINFKSLVGFNFIFLTKHPFWFYPMAKYRRLTKHVKRRVKQREKNFRLVDDNGQFVNFEKNRDWEVYTFPHFPNNSVIDQLNNKSSPKN